MELPILNTYINFSRHHFRCFTGAPLFILDKSTAWNRCLQHPCFKNLCKIAQASKKLDSNTQHFLSDLLTHIHDVHSVLFALPGYQFPYTVMNRCFYHTDIFDAVTDLTFDRLKGTHKRCFQEAVGHSTLHIR